ncbi:hypothetical protein TSUD_232240 [Trifolium subterraneum]|uniref:Uncharacterized protein n=1 Tax=Trifolium subterraneum TaxID=3900 RepID=A0A2Z6MGX2_TRISU|nr:hypothetical protein TSUD_232240 [Trifolium subterraneum]
MFSVTGVISRMALQEILTCALGEDVVRNASNVVDFVDGGTNKLPTYTGYTSYIGIADFVQVTCNGVHFTKNLLAKGICLQTKCVLNVICLGGYRCTRNIFVFDRGFIQQTTTQKFRLFEVGFDFENIDF